MAFGTLAPMDARVHALMTAAGVECMSCRCRWRGSYPFGMLRLARYLSHKRMEILHTHLFDPSVVGLTAGMLARTPARVLTRHYSDYHTRIRRRAHVALDRMCTRLAQAVIAVSAHTAEHLVSVEGAPREKVHTILNGIDFARVKPSPQAWQHVRSGLGVESDHLILVMARLHPEKGHTYLFQALPGIRERVGRRLLVLLAGTGPYEVSYREEVARLGCEDIVRFLGFRHDAADLMVASDLVVLPSEAEAFGLVLAEALFLGRPVVATRAGGIPEIVDDGVDGILVSPAEPQALEDAVVRLLTDDALRKSMGHKGRKKVAKRFRFDRMMGEYETLYDHLLADA
jgi:glycosyltransferase involved in cell wall biosynthesis